jgi:hypothetical protein
MQQRAELKGPLTINCMQERGQGQRALERREAGASGNACSGQDAYYKEEVWLLSALSPHGRSLGKERFLSSGHCERCIVSRLALYRVG